MPAWSFCRKCAWHSVGLFDKCPKCRSRHVRYVDTDPLLDADGQFRPAPGKHEKEKRS